MLFHYIAVPTLCRCEASILDPYSSELYMKDLDFLMIHNTYRFGARWNEIPLFLVISTQRRFLLWGFSTLKLTAQNHETYKSGDRAIIAAQLSMHMRMGSF